MTNVVLDSQWLLSSSCEGPPDALFSFNVTDLSLEYPTDQESWPNTYYLLAPFDNCGVLTHEQFQRTGGCCQSSLAVDTTIYKSFTVARMQSLFDMTRAPQAAKDSVYCHLYDPGDSSLFGYNSWWLKPGSCVEEYFRCTPDGQMSVYNYTGCRGTPLETHYLSNLPQSYESDYLGQFTAKIESISNPNGRTTFLASFPLGRLVPNFQTPVEILSLICWILTFLVILVVPIEVLLLKIYKRPVSNWMYGHIFAFSLLCVSTIMNLYQWTLKITTEEDRIGFYVSLQVGELVWSWISLWTMLSTTSIVIAPILLLNRPTWYKNVFYVSVFVFHVVFYGPCYFTYLVFSQRLNPLASGFTTFVNGWRSIFLEDLIVIARISPFIYNFLPPFLVAYSIVRERLQNNGLMQVIYHIVDLDYKFLLYMLSFVIICICFIVLDVYLFYVPEMMSSDRAIYASNGFLFLLQSLFMLLHVKIASVMKAALLGKLSEKLPQHSSLELDKVPKPTQMRTTILDTELRDKETII
ncbi:hypothetical protein EDD86DRAFT_270618 [Gorgonomyces haynaldii]|nr:hypothetical protein EDD86DRAFT_270618 [Gorgonomyces haynaldii]